MTEHQLKEFLEENKADIQAAVKKATIDRLLQEYRWTFTDEINKAVHEFIAAEVIPEVQSALAEQKGPIVAQLLAGIASITDDLAKNLAADAAKTIGSEWKRRDIVKALFGH